LLRPLLSLANAIASSTPATIAIAIEVIAFAEIPGRRYGSAITAPASEPTPTHVKTRPSWAAESCISLSAITGKSAGTIEIALRESESEEAPRSCINRVAARSWAETTVPDNTLASHKRQNSGFPSANQVEVDFILIASGMKRALHDAIPKFAI